MIKSMKRFIDLYKQLSINIMQENNRSSVSRSPPYRNSDKYQDIYVEEAHHYRAQQHLRKHLYAQIIQKGQQRLQQKVKLQRQLQKMQNQQNDLFWKNGEERIRAAERKRKEEIDEVRRINNTQHQQSLHKSMTVDPYYLQKSYHDDLTDFQLKERKKKEEKEHFYRQGMMLQQMRQQKLRFQRQNDKEVFRQKQQEKQEQENKKAQFFNQWRQKHFEDKHQEARRLLDQINHKKELDSSRLEEIIAVKGGIQLHQRMSAVRAAQIEEQAVKKEKFVQDLKNQVEENTYKAAIDRYLELNYERNKMDQINKTLDERDAAEKQRKKSLHNGHLNALKGQMRPRNLLPEPQKKQFAGIGSPAHIGKIVHEDRLNQLKWIERNFMQSLKQI